MLLKGALYALLFGGVFFVACKKETNVETPTLVQNQQVPQEKYQYVAAYESYQVPTSQVRGKVANLQTAFQNQRTQSKSMTYMPISEAVWSIEALANAEEGHAGFVYKQLKLQKHYVTLPTIQENGELKVALSEVESKYQQAVDWMLADEAALNYPAANKESILANVSPMTDEQGNLVLEITVATGYDPTCIGCATPYTPICAETTNSWKAGFKAGTCAGQYFGIADASDVIEGFINSIALEDCPIRYALNDIVFVHRTDGFFANLIDNPRRISPFSYPNPNDNQRFDGYREYLLFHTSSTTPRGYDDCLSISDVNFYRDGAIEVIRKEMMINLQTNPSRFSGKYLNYCDIIWDLTPNTTQNIMHRLTFTVGDFIR